MHLVSDASPESSTMMVLDVTAALAPLTWVLTALLALCTLAIVLAAEREVVWKNPRHRSPKTGPAGSLRRPTHLYLVPPRSSREATV